MPQSIDVSARLPDAGFNAPETAVHELARGLLQVDDDAFTTAEAAWRAGPRQTLTTPLR